MLRKYTNEIPPGRMDDLLSSGILMGLLIEKDEKTSLDIRQATNIMRTLVGNEIVDYSDVFNHSRLYTWLQWIG